MMNHMHGAILVLLTLSAVGCRTIYDTPQKVTAASAVEHDAYEGTTWIKAPLVSYGDGFSECFLRTLTTKGGAPTNQLYVIYKPREWVFLDRATDREGKPLRTLVIDRDVSTYASLSEHVAVELADDYLANAARVGLDIQLRGKSGRTVVRLPPHYVQGFLDKLNAVPENKWACGLLTRRCRRTAAARPPLIGKALDRRGEVDANDRKPAR